MLARNIEYPLVDPEPPNYVELYVVYTEK